jgi:predicted ATPase
MVSMMIDDGLIRRAGGGWVASVDLGDLTVPPSISALLAARLDRLAPAERSVLERAAVIGQVFYLGAVESPVPGGLRADVQDVTSTAWPGASW